MKSEQAYTDDLKKSKSYITPNLEACCVTDCEQSLDFQYWNRRWELNETAWDIGYVAPVFEKYFKALENKDIAILIPGCGNAYEADFLLKSGFRHLTLIDIAPIVVENLRKKFSDKPGINILCEDYFHHQGKYDLILEQTFFCAILPSQRKNYVAKAAEILNENGRIVGLLFDEHFTHQGPPFGGCPCEYRPIFEPIFEILKMELCTNSIKPRQGKELFIDFKKR